MSKNSTNDVLIIVGVAVVAVALGFFSGMKYQESKVPVGMMQLRGQRGVFGQRMGQGRNGGAVIGEILSGDDRTITVKMQDGSSKIVILSNTTSINKASQGTKSDLKKGERVAVFGAANSDGSITAQSIQLNPMMRMGGPRPTQTQ